MAKPYENYKEKFITIINANCNIYVAYWQL